MVNARFWQLISGILFFALIILTAFFLLQKHDQAWQEKLQQAEANQTTLKLLAYQQGGFDTLSQIVTITAQCKPLPVKLGNLSVTLIAAECLQQNTTR